MANIKQSEGNKRFDEIIKSESFKEYYNEQHTILMVSVLLQEAMEKKHLTQSVIAERMGISQADVSKVLSGKKENITIKTLQKFCNAIGVTPTLSLV